MARKIIPLDDPNDRKFMEDLFQKHDRLILATVKKYVSDVHDQEDATQTVAERLIWYIQKLKQLSPKACNAYIIYTAKSVAMDLHKSQARYKKSFSSLDEEGEEHSILDSDMHGHSIDSHIILQEQMAQLKKNWHELSEEDRLLLEGKYIWELSDKELAECLRCKTDSVRMKLTRARSRAFQHLRQREEV